VPDAEAARVFAAVKEKARAPLVADIHFNKNLALLARRRARIACG